MVWWVETSRVWILGQTPHLTPEMNQENCRQQTRTPILSASQLCVSCSQDVVFALMLFLVLHINCEGKCRLKMIDNIFLTPLNNDEKTFSFIFLETLQAFPSALELEREHKRTKYKRIMGWYMCEENGLLYSVAQHYIYPLHPEISVKNHKQPSREISWESTK